MPEYLILVDSEKDWKPEFPACPVTTVRDYLTGDLWSGRKHLHVINLCHDLSYQSLGYYASLLAEARGHKVVPSVEALQDLTRKTLYGPLVDDLDESLSRTLAKWTDASETSRFEVMFYFGQCDVEPLRSLGRRLFEVFRVPMLRVTFQHQGRWRISRLKLGSLRRLDASQREQFFAALQSQLGRRWKVSVATRPLRYDLAILYNPEEQLPPSDAKALSAFIKAAAEQGIAAELITPRDFGRLLEYDALFIRETTALNHHTYRFARKAASEGMVVMDDPDSIRRCVNKIFLSELLGSNKVPAPASVVLARGELDRAEAALGYPMVLKIPDGSFSRGMFKARDRAEMESASAQLFEHSELILAQAFTYTEFDWRIGVLNGEALYACRYYMSRGHWQIINHADGSKPKEGKWDTLALNEVPPQVLEVALKAARLVGNGLYGVDLKQTGNGVLVIEVNDNPSLEFGVEDKVLGKALYQRIMAEFLRRLNER